MTFRSMDVIPPVKFKLSNNYGKNINRLFCFVNKLSEKLLINDGWAFILSYHVSTLGLLPIPHRSTLACIPTSTVNQIGGQPWTRTKNRITSIVLPTLTPYHMLMSTYIDNLFFHLRHPPASLPIPPITLKERRRL